MSKKVISPCISICRTDPVTGYCYGCARTNEEKKIWKEENTKNEWKEQNLQIIISRMQGWQLETFKESYNHKKITVFLYLKKVLLRNKIINLFSSSPYRSNDTLRLD